MSIAPSDGGTFLISIARKFQRRDKRHRRRHNQACEHIAAVARKQTSQTNVAVNTARLWNKCPLLEGHLPHDGRHTCATLPDDADVPLKINRLILGHSAHDIDFAQKLPLDFNIC